LNLKSYNCLALEIVSIDDKYHEASQMHVSSTILIQVACYIPLVTGSESADLLEQAQDLGAMDHSKCLSLLDAC
jgi:hypothetical protein